jgi:hypothetical protein
LSDAVSYDFGRRALQLYIPRRPGGGFGRDRRFNSARQSRTRIIRNGRCTPRFVSEPVNVLEVTGLGPRLLKSRGKTEEARKMLAEIYNWFTEGFEFADLKDAKALLAELGN